MGKVHGEVMPRLAFLLLALLLPALAAAQPWPIFDVDDFVDPGQHDGVMLASRLVTGGVLNYIDDYRPRHHGAGFVLLANSFYLTNYEIDYKHSEVRSGPTPPVQMCPCVPPVFFPTPPSAESTPAAPPPGPKDTLQFGSYFYWPWQKRKEQPVRIRVRLTIARQRIDSDVTFLDPSKVATRLHGQEQTVGLDTDTYLRLGGREIFGALHYARTVRSGTADDRKQQEIAYTNRFPSFAVRSVIVGGMLTIGTVTGRGGTGFNLVNPMAEASWHDSTTGVNLHLVWGPQATRSGTGGWETHHQIALFADRGIVKLFKH
jgi:hypothetical protein